MKLHSIQLNLEYFRKLYFFYFDEFRKHRLRNHINFPNDKMQRLSQEQIGESNTNYQDYSNGSGKDQWSGDLS